MSCDGCCVREKLPQSRATSVRRVVAVDEMGARTPRGTERGGESTDAEHLENAK